MAEEQRKRIGELLVEMGFINEDQLEKAVNLAREKQMKIGEALYYLGALDRDHIYWVLGNQLSMNYLVLSPDMIDDDLLKRFSLDKLEQLACLPLYESESDIHYAIADPANPAIISSVENLHPEKNAVFHLALPEKIDEIIEHFRRKMKRGKIERPQTPGTGLLQQAPSEAVLWRKLNDLIIDSHPGSALCAECKGEKSYLWKREEAGYSKVMESQSSGFDYVIRKLKEVPESLNRGAFFFTGKTEEQIPARVNMVSNAERRVVIFRRMVPFNRKEFIQNYPGAEKCVSNLVEKLKNTDRIFLGWENKAFALSCLFALVAEMYENAVFPPPVSVEIDPEIHVPDILQLEKEDPGNISFLRNLGYKQISIILYHVDREFMKEKEQMLCEALNSCSGKIIVHGYCADKKELENVFKENSVLAQNEFEAVLVRDNKII